MSLLENLQLLPPKTNTSQSDPSVNSPAVQTLTLAFARLSVGERKAALANLQPLSGAYEDFQAQQFQATWTGLGIGLVLGVGGLIAYNHLAGR